MKDTKNVDSLLRATLSSKESPDELLNIKLKSSLRRQADKIKTISLWWLPMAASIIISLGTVILVNMFVLNYTVGLLINTLILGNTIFNILITLIGVKFFNLKKGAEIKL